MVIYNEKFNLEKVFLFFIFKIHSNEFLFTTGSLLNCKSMCSPTVSGSRQHTGHISLANSVSKSV